MVELFLKKIWKKYFEYNFDRFLEYNERETNDINVIKKFVEKLLKYDVDLYIFIDIRSK